MENSPSGTWMRVGHAVLIGHLLVTLPVFVFICGLTFFGMFVALFLLPYEPLLLFVFIIPGFILAWLWWSLLVPQWHNWAHRQGDELQKWAVRTGLVWPKGWIFEKTEYKWTDDKSQSKGEFISWQKS
jgi:hypothetical protein